MRCAVHLSLLVLLSWPLHAAAGDRLDRLRPLKRGLGQLLSKLGRTECTLGLTLRLKEGQHRVALPAGHCVTLLVTEGAKLDLEARVNAGKLERMTIRPNGILVKRVAALAKALKLDLAWWKAALADLLGGVRAGPIELRSTGGRLQARVDGRVAILRQTLAIHRLPAQLGQLLDPPVLDLIEGAEGKVTAHRKLAFDSSAMRVRSELHATEKFQLHFPGGVSRALADLSDSELGALLVELGQRLERRTTD